MVSHTELRNAEPAGLFDVLIAAFVRHCRPRRILLVEIGWRSEADPAPDVARDWLFPEHDLPVVAENPDICVLCSATVVRHFQEPPNQSVGVVLKVDGLALIDRGREKSVIQLFGVCIQSAKNDVVAVRAYILHKYIAGQLLHWRSGIERA